MTNYSEDINNAGNRKKEIKKDLGVEVIDMKYKKPNPKAFRQALEYFNNPDSDKVAMVGDRLFTDIIGAKGVGFYTILVKPIEPKKDPLYIKLARPVEEFIRMLYFRKHMQTV